MADEIQELRNRGRLLEAMVKLREAVEADWRRGSRLWRKHVFGSRCLLLEMAHNQVDAPGTLAEVRQAVKAAQSLLALPDGYGKLLAARLLVIEAVLDGDWTGEAIERLLESAARQYAESWAYQPPADCPAVLGGGGELAFVRRLPNDRMRDLFRRLADRLGDQHAGLALVGETLVYLCSQYLPAHERTNGPAEVSLPRDHAVQTWVLLADRSSGTGFPARLHVERVANGCGTVYPDPLAGGYLWTMESFQTGIQNAWLAALHESPSACHYDFRWWLDLTDPVDELPRLAELKGRSAELAFAVAIRAAAERDVLDGHAVATACLRDAAAGDLRLDVVGAVAVKAGAVLHQLKNMSEILVADGQDVPLEGRASSGDGGRSEVAGSRIELDDGRLAIIPCGTFGEVYEQLSHWTRVTRHVNGRLAARAEKELQECNPYVRLPMSRRDERLVRGPDQDSWHRLSPEQLGEFCCGRLRLETLGGETESQSGEAPRLAVLAESGMGKSTLLCDCLRSIAANESERVAVLVRDLSEIPWGHTEDALRELVERPLANCFERKRAADHEQEAEDRYQWFRRLLRQGNVVLLLDAVDQTGEGFDFGPVAGFLASEDVRGCPVIVTGREHVKSTRNKLFDKQAWQVFRLDGFQTEDDAQADLRQFLGNVADALLIDYHKPGWNFSDDNRCKLGWQELLRVPLLARLLRLLARDGRLHDLKNREAVYQQAMSALIEQGFRSLQRGHADHRLLDTAEAVETLEELAWQSIAQDDFRGQVADDSWQALHRQFKDQPWSELEQVDIITIHTVLERATATRLSWRHLSFCEYFAGARLAGLSREEQTEVARARARNRQWNWMFRYALSWLEREGDRQGLDHLARCLVRYGNPFVLYEAIDQDEIELAGWLDRLCRWLVHRHHEEWNYSDFGFAWTEGDTPPTLDLAALEILEDLLRREYRASPCLHPAWELVRAVLGEEGAAPTDAGLREMAERISARFLGEFPEICGNSADPGYDTAQSLLVSFVRCPEDPEVDGKPFLMGSPQGVGDDGENPQHLISLEPFHLMHCPLTNAQYELFAPQHAAFWNECGREENHPATNVNWYMAEMFCTWLGEGYRLPTQAQWEYACRAGSQTAYCFGDTELELGEYAWYFDNSGRSTHPVGRKRPNAWGLYDMHGNVYEWCQDWDDDDIRDWDDDDPRYWPRACRGGSCCAPAGDCRSASRYFEDPSCRRFDLSFRVCRVQADE